MKPHEILSMLPQWADAAPEALLDSPAWAMPCRLGEDSTVLRTADVTPCDTLNLAVLLDGESHVLSIADSPRFTDIHALWPSRAEVPGPDARTLFAQVNDVVFGLTRSSTVEAAFGQLRFIDCAHQAVRDTVLPCETELAAFTLPAADLASLAVGDALLLPEVGTVPPRLVVDGRFVVDENGVLPFKDDGRLRVVGAEARTLTLGELFDRAQNPAAEKSEAPTQLRLVAFGKTAAQGRLEQLASHPAFIVESLA